jgi:Thiamine pyrophosphate enzyme, N-terminal TPP binding domain
MSTLCGAKAKEKQQTAGKLLVRSLVQQGVKYIFGVPGGKIMPTFDVLRDEGPKLIDEFSSSASASFPPGIVIKWPSIGVRVKKPFCVARPLRFPPLPGSPFVHFVPGV